MKRKYEIAVNQSQVLSNAHHAEAEKLAFKAGHNSEGYFRELRRVAVTMGPRNCVYFIRMGKTDAVKVGYTQHGLQRLAALQNSSPVKCHLDAYVNFVDHDGAFEGECRAHVIAAEKGSLLRGEWFEMKPDVVAATAKALVLSQPDRVIAAIWKEQP